MQKILPVAALVVCVSGCGDHADVGVGALRSAIIGGTIDSTHDAVVAVVDTDTSAVCTGTFIAPTYVLTAAHCAETPGSKAIVAGVNVVAAPDYSVAVTNATVHPEWNLAAPDDGHDIAVLEIDGVAPVAPIGVLDVADPLVYADGVVMTAVGYGTTNAGASFEVTRHTVDLTVTQVSAQTLLYESTTANTCGGDSGGPMLVVRGTAEVVVAITSFGDVGCGQFSGMTRTDANAPFLAPFLSTGDDDDDDDDDDDIGDDDDDGGAGCGCAIPAGGSSAPIASLMLAALTFAIRRRR